MGPGGYLLGRTVGRRFSRPTCLEWGRRHSIITAEERADDHPLKIQ